MKCGGAPTSSRRISGGDAGGAGVVRPGDLQVARDADDTHASGLGLADLGSCQCRPSQIGELSLAEQRVQWRIEAVCESLGGLEVDLEDTPTAFDAADSARCYAAQDGHVADRQVQLQAAQLNLVHVQFSP